MAKQRADHGYGHTDESAVDTAFGLALALILLSVFVTISVGPTDAEELSPALFVLTGVLQAMAVVATVWVSGLRDATRNTLIAIVVGTAIVAALVGLVGGRTAAIVASAFWLSITATLPVLVARRLRVFERITLQTVLGYLVIYAMAGVLFAYGYRICELVSPPALDPSPQRAAGCMYYSYVTLTTLGYGDISPVSGVARALSITEAVLGQLYLVSVVGLVVGNLGRQKHPSLRVEDPADERAAD